MYHIIHIISAFVRQFALPNPFVNFFSNELDATIFNLVVGGVILHLLAYTMTGVIYKRRTAPSVGSALYLINYILIIGVISLVTWLVHNSWISITICSMLYILALILLNHFSNKKYDF